MTSKKPARRAAKRSSPANLKRRSSPSTKIGRLIRKAEALGVATGMVMPFDEIRLGVKLSEQPRSLVLPKLLALAEHENMHARRIALSALRRMKAWDDERAFEVFLRGLSDPEGWVRYDAAWALGDSGTRDRRALSALKKAASTARAEPDLNDGDARAAAQAAESLHELRPSPRNEKAPAKPGLS